MSSKAIESLFFCPPDKRAVRVNLALYKPSVSNIPDICETKFKLLEFNFFVLNKTYIAVCAINLFMAPLLCSVYRALIEQIFNIY